MIFSLRLVLLGASVMGHVSLLLSLAACRYHRMAFSGLIKARERPRTRGERRR
ncbi:hypothetical protein NC653_030680 [Populus alba x Populus x berolinensis]|uniref:Uncharacterized protein n=1 Tax=Populus alba x Populus x berolinensis TaxID=444605 RepID=A0AAD6Q1R3_9ROSI|nr:hypothetical protein NC653_030680 [Populus alba x Populus x berolinensis]